MRYIVLVAVCFLFVSSYVYSQSYNMNINLSNGEVVSIPVDDIQRIVFDYNASGVDDTETGQRLAEPFKLMPNYPNPFNPTTTIEYQIPNSAHVNIGIYDIRGRHVKTIVNDNQTGGLHTATWNGTDSRNAPVASGVYFCTVECDNSTLTTKLILLK